MRGQFGSRIAKNRAWAAIVVGSMILSFAAPAGIVSGHGYGKSNYSADVTPTSAAAGTTATFDVRLKLLSASGHKKLLSVRVDAPAGFSIVSASARNSWTHLPAVISGNSVTVDGLWLWKPGQTAVVRIEAAIGCGVSGAAQWDTVGHNTVEFTHQHASTLSRHPDSALVTDVSSCGLAFVAGSQPANAAANSTITNTPNDPSGGPVQVQLLDGNGDPSGESGVPVSVAIAAGTGTSGAVLNGATNAFTDSAGLASFASLSIDRAGFDYGLVASSAATGGVLSDPFDIIAGTLVECSGDCSLSIEEGNTEATLSTTTGPGGFIAASLGVESLSCDDKANKFYKRTSEVLSWEVGGSTSIKRVTFKVDKSAVNKPFWAFQVCFSTPVAAFKNRYGVTIQPNQAGLLPDCDFFGHHQQGLPCVLWRWRDFHGNVYVKFLLDEDDPRGHV